MRALVLFVAAATFTVAFSTPVQAQSYQRVAYYIVAHQDDWQLFMTPSAYEDARAHVEVDDVAVPTRKVVFIYLTAGDGGFGLGKVGRQHPYYKAREQGALDAARFIATPDNVYPGKWSTSTVIVNGNKIARHAYLNTVSYFLELPDGNGDGSGFTVTGNQSLKRLHDTSISTMRSITGQATYYGWWDLVSTVATIIGREKEPNAQLWLNYPDPDPLENAGDHSDHFYTGRAARDASVVSCATATLHAGYSTGLEGTEANLTDPEHEVEAAVFGVTVSGIMRFDHESRWEGGHRKYLGRSYARTIPSTCG
jgi:hypothetical protein